jgi:hypothetical protein
VETRRSTVWLTFQQTGAYLNGRKKPDKKSVPAVRSTRPMAFNGMTDKKGLIRRYKQTILEMGIYQIKNKITGKIFIGNAKNLKGILNSNKFQLKTGRHFNRELQHDFNTFGDDAFDFEILDSLKPKEDPEYDYTDDLITLEDMWLEKLQPYHGKGYNSKKPDR